MASNPIRKNPPTRADSTIEQVNREIPERTQTEVRKELGIEIIKSIVFGGLDVLIASSSVLLCGIAANVDIAYFMVLVRIALFAMMVIIGYTMEIIYHDRDQYEEVFGRSENSGLHVVVALISCSIFELLPPVVYICSFRESGDKQLNLVMVAVASLLCIMVLAIGRTFTEKQYSKGVFFTDFLLVFISMGVSFAIGLLVNRLF